MKMMCSHYWLGFQRLSCSPDGLENQSLALSATAAEGDDACPTSGALEGQRLMQYEPGARCADRMPEGNGSAIGVDPVCGDAKVVSRLDEDGSKGLIDLD